MKGIKAPNKEKKKSPSKRASATDRSGEQNEAIAAAASLRGKQLRSLLGDLPHVSSKTIIKEIDLANEGDALADPEAEAMGVDVVKETESFLPPELPVFEPRPSEEKDVSPDPTLEEEAIPDKSRSHLVEETLNESAEEEVYQIPSIEAAASNVDKHITADKVGGI